jgi:transcriptional regulator with XRE-family HTH domain
MEKHLKNLLEEVDEFFVSEPDANQKAWGIINDFYNQVLTIMEENKISKSELAKRLNKSRSSVTQLLNNTPNISVKKMVEMAEALGTELDVNLKYFNKCEQCNELKKNDVKFLIVNIFKWESLPDEISEMNYNFDTDLQFSNVQFN